MYGKHSGADRGLGRPGGKANWNFIIEKMVVEQRLEEGEGVNHKAEGCLGDLVPGRGKSYWS